MRERKREKERKREREKERERNLWMNNESETDKLALADWKQINFVSKCFSSFICFQNLDLHYSRK